MIRTVLVVDGPCDGEWRTIDGLAPVVLTPKGDMVEWDEHEYHVAKLGALFGGRPDDEDVTHDLFNDRSAVRVVVSLALWPTPGIGEQILDTWHSGVALIRFLTRREL